MIGKYSLNLSPDLHHVCLLVQRELLARVKMTIIIRMERTSGLLLLATPMKGHSTGKPLTASTRLLSWILTALWSADLLTSDQYSYYDLVFNYSSVYLVPCKMHPSQHRSIGIPASMTHSCSAGNMSVFGTWCGRMLQLHLCLYKRQSNRPVVVFVSYLYSTECRLSRFQECSACASYPPSSLVCVRLSLPLSGLDTAQHMMRTSDDITAAHLRVAPSFLK